MLNRSKSLIKPFSLAILITTMATEPAFAAGSETPWEGPLDHILTSLSGPVARVIGVASIIITGLWIAFREGGGGRIKVVLIDVERRGDKVSVFDGVGKKAEEKIGERKKEKSM